MHSTLKNWNNYFWAIPFLYIDHDADLLHVLSHSRCISALLCEPSDKRLPLLCDHFGPSKGVVLYEGEPLYKLMDQTMRRDTGTLLFSRPPEGNTCGQNSILMIQKSHSHILQPNYHILIIDFCTCQASQVHTSLLLK